MRFQTHVITLDELDANHLFVEVRSPGVLPWGYMKKLSKNPDPELIDDMLKRLIVDWNLTDENGNVYPIPSEKPEVLDEIPSGVLTVVLERLTELTQVNKR